MPIRGGRLFGKTLHVLNLYQPGRTNLWIDQPLYHSICLFIDAYYADILIIHKQKIQYLAKLGYSPLIATKLYNNHSYRIIRALQKGMQHFDLDQGIILTIDQEETIVVDNFVIAVIPVAKWLRETGEDIK